MNQPQVENASAPPVKRKSTARTELVSAAAEAKFLDVAGRVDVSRAMGLIANQGLLEASSERSARKEQAGIHSAPKGLIIQINKRIKIALGDSVTNRKTDDEFQEVVALIRSRVLRVLRESNVDYFSKDWEEHDKAIKLEIYTIIDRMAAAYLSGK